jgi:SAM-dependent methyltransferase
MKRAFLFSCYQTPRGKLLQALEIKYLRSVIDVSYQQILLQIGALGFEDEFVDDSLFQKFIILDNKGLGTDKSIKIQAKSFCLPIQSESVDRIILPHLLEFDAYRFQTMREVERILKPEGQLIILNFNPWSVWLKSQCFWDKRLSESWKGHFISRTRVLDWLKLLNFKIQFTTEFEIDSFRTTRGAFSLNKNTLLAPAYAIKAVKQRYTLMPLREGKIAPMRLNMAAALKFKRPMNQND